jgi:hypothetical protein
MTTEFMGKRYPFLSLIKSGVSGLGRGVAKWACACLARSETHSQHKKKKIKKKMGWELELLPLKGYIPRT